MQTATARLTSLQPRPILQPHQQHSTGGSTHKGCCACNTTPQSLMLPRRTHPLPMLVYAVLLCTCAVCTLAKLCTESTAAAATRGAVATHTAKQRPTSHAVQPHTTIIGSQCDHNRRPITHCWTGHQDDAGGWRDLHRHCTCPLATGSACTITWPPWLNPSTPVLKQLLATQLSTQLQVRIVSKAPSPPVGVGLAKRWMHSDPTSACQRYLDTQGHQPALCAADPHSPANQHTTHALVSPPALQLEPGRHLTPC
jgi:hypothetical protein